MPIFFTQIYPSYPRYFATTRITANVYCSFHYNCSNIITTSWRGSAIAANISSITILKWWCGPREEFAHENTNHGRQQAPMAMAMAMAMAKATTTTTTGVENGICNRCYSCYLGANVKIKHQQSGLPGEPGNLTAASWAGQWKWRSPQERGRGAPPSSSPPSLAPCRPST